MLYLKNIFKILKISNLSKHLFYRRKAKSNFLKTLIMKYF